MEIWTKEGDLVLDIDALPHEGEIKDLKQGIELAVKCNKSLCRAHLFSAKLRFANLKGARLAGANLNAADLAGAYLKEADLTGANLQMAFLKDADLSGADLRYANLRYAVLEGANLTHAMLEGADVTGTDREKELSNSGDSYQSTYIHVAKRKKRA